jgi:hypothetical protein
MVTVGNLVRNVDAYGGVGVGAQKGELYLANSSAYGGTGGTLSANGGDFVVNVDGGDAIYVLNGLVSCDGLYAEGGQGGSATTDGADSASTANGGNGISIDGSTLANSVVNSEVVGGKGGYFDNGTGAAAADGGSGLWATNVSSLLMISNATLTGGAGGTVVGEAAGISANGGDGVDISSSTITILGGTFSGGAAGTNNGVLAEAGYAARFTDVDLIIGNDASFTGRGVVVDSETSGNNIEITGGTFSAIEFGGDSVIDISGGTFESDLLFTGMGTQELSIVSAETTGGVMVRETQLTVTDWDQEVFKNTTVASGTINFSNQVFALGSDSSFILESQNAAANFNGGLTVNGGSLDVGFGTVTSSTFTAQTGSKIVTGFDGTTNGLIKGDVVSFEAGVDWTIDGGTNAPDEGHVFTLAESTTSNLTSALVREDVEFVGSAGNWMAGITALNTDARYLQAVYGTIPLLEALERGVGLDPTSELGKVADDLFPTLGDAQVDILKDIPTAAAAEKLLTDAYVRTPEVASTLIGLQEVFVGQINNRSRSYRLLQKGASSAPQGASGPAYDDTITWLENNLPSWGMRDKVKAADESLPRPNLKGDLAAVNKPYVSSPNKQGAYKSFRDWLAGLFPKPAVDQIDVPATYQVWGRAYASEIDQGATIGQSGYDAVVGGALIGVDKRFNNLLLGVGGGYSYATLQGGDSNDADANTGHGVAYAAINGDVVYIDANVSYTYSDVETEGSGTLGYTGNYGAQTASMYLGGGLEFATWKDRLLISPEASLLSTYYSRESFTETSSLGFTPKSWDSYNQWSYLSSVGATLSMIRHIESFNLEMEFQPEIRVHWLHEFNADMDAPTYMLAGGANSINVALQAREEDLVKIGGGVRFSKWQSDTFELGLDVDGVLGQDYSAYIISGKLMHRF